MECLLPNTTYFIAIVTSRIVYEPILSYDVMTVKYKVSKLFLVYHHSVKSVPIRSYSGPHFPAFGLNTERYGVYEVPQISFKRKLAN